MEAGKNVSVQMKDTNSDSPVALTDISPQFDIVSTPSDEGRWSTWNINRENYQLMTYQT